MSSEEKEAYFDGYVILSHGGGPLITTPNSQGLYYPGGNPPPRPHFAPLGGMQQSPASIPQAPAFYNPGNVLGNPWEVPVQQPPYNAGPHDNPAIPGAQAYFGRVDSGQSASSSQQTTPERNPGQKMTDVRLFNPSNYESHAESPGAAALFTPQVEESASSSNSQPVQYHNQFLPERANMQSSTPPSGGASGQQSFVPNLAASLFVPRADVNNAGVQNYMNPVPHGNTQHHQPQFFIPAPNPDLTQAASLQHGEDESTGDPNIAIGHQIDLHNGTPNHNATGSDQSYMNMAYNHSYPGNTPQDNAVSAYVHGELQIDAGPPVMMIPVTTSGQDYDILHSQGTWRDLHHTVQDSNENHGPIFLDGGTVSEAIPLQSNMVGDLEDGGLENHDFRENLQPEETQEEVADVEISHSVSNDQLASGIVSGAQGSTLYLPGSDSLGSDSNLASDHLKVGRESDQVHVDSATLSLDYKGHFENSAIADEAVMQDGSELDDKIQDVQQSSDMEPIHNEAADEIVLPQQELPPLQNDGYAVGGSVVSADEKEDKTSAESPIPADGLHHRQPLLDDSLMSGSHHFASANSAFESRIRSQSTGSNNSNSSSQKSASGLSGRAGLNRNFLQLGAAAAAENNSSRLADTVPTSSPFSTEAMHSSHNPDAVPASASYASVPLARAAIPDIVRPSNSRDENLRTGATMVPYSCNQSLHSQVLRNITAYPPEPRMSLSTASATVMTPGRSQPDLVQSPMEGSGAIPKTSGAVANSVTGLKVSNVSSESTPEVVPATDAETPSASHDLYLSRSLHNSSSNLPSTSAEKNQPPSQEPDVSLSHSKVDDLHEHVASEQSNPDTRQFQNDDRRHSDSLDRDHRYKESDARDSKWNDERPRRDEHRSRDEDPRYRRDDEYRNRGDDSRNRDEEHRSRADESNRRDDEYRSRDDDRFRGRWDPVDDRYREERYSDSRSRPDHYSRPSSRQSGYAHEDSYYSRQYDDRYYDRSYGDPYYKDPYSRYHGYDRRDHYDYDRRGGQYYDYRRYPEHYRDYHGYDRYNYNSYHEYQYTDPRRPDEEDSRSVYSEKSRTADREQVLDREWRARHDYDYYNDPRYAYHHHSEVYGDESTVDGSTLSHTFDESWQRLPQASVRQTPVKFGSVHTIVRFGAGGQLLKVRPNRPTDNQPTTVEIHSLEVLLQDTEEAEDLRSYPGPLSKEETHKNDVLQFTSNQALDTLKDYTLMDRQSTSLIWEFLALLVRQNGSVLGTDIAELLTKDHSGDFTLLQSPLDAIKQRQQQHGIDRATPISVSDEPCASSSPVAEQAETKSIISNVSVDVTAVALEKNCFRFRDLLLHGRKKDALEWAMKSGLWGHALLLASKTDSRTHAQVMIRFANSLPINDPLQTVYQLMSGRQPAAATCVSEEGWGDWRPHLAMILSNPTPNPSLDMRAVLTMGDTLSTRGLLHAAHFCYLMSSTPLGYYGRTSSKMVLLGGNHMLSFEEFAKWESIRRTEIYEYAISLGKQQKSSSASMSLPSFQLYKFLYACKLAEYGLIAQAFHYCERIAKSICKSPNHYSQALVNQLVNLSDQLRHHDPQIQAGVAQAGNLRWLEILRNILLRMQAGSIVPRVNVSSSAMTTSNTSSVISSSPTADGDEIDFSAHTPDLEDEKNVEFTSNQVPVSQYGQDERQQPPYAYPQVQENASMDQNPLQSYAQESPNTPLYNPTQGFNYQDRPVEPYMNQNAPSFQPQQPSTQNNFSYLASQANPLGSAYQPPRGPNDMPAVSYQTQSSYGFQPHPSNNDSEQAEQLDQVDYYNHIENMQRGHHQIESSRVRSTSQSSQRSRGSTVKGYDRNTPTPMNSHGDKMGRRSRTTSENSGRRSRKTSGEQHSTQKKAQEKDGEVKKSGSWLFNWFSRRKSNQVHLPDDNEKEIVWDNEKKRWVNKNGTEEDSAPAPPPPTDTSLAPSAAPLQMPQTSGAPTQNLGSSGGGPPSGPSQLTANRYSLKNLGGNRSMYKNAFSASSKPVTAPAPIDLPGMQVAPNVSGFMIPNPVPTSQPQEPRDETNQQRNLINPPDAPQSIPMFTPGNTPHGSSNDFTQPFNHENLTRVSLNNNIGRNSSSSSVSSSAREVQNLTNMAEGESSNVSNMAPVTSMTTPVQDAGASAGPTMFFNPSQLAAQPDLLAQPGMPPMGRGNSMARRGRGRPVYPGRT